MKFIISLVFSLVILTHAQATQTIDQRPNFLIILTDDQRADSFTQEFMPKTFAWIVNQGLKFENSFATTPLCCPSRTSILTGLYARNHKVYSNSVDINSSTFDQTGRFPELLKNTGYKTAMIGKYLNVLDDTPRTHEFDYWVSLGNKHTYHEYSLNVQGTKTKYKNQYITKVLGNYAADWLQNQNADEPFLLYFAVKAPHDPATPEKKYRNLYKNLAAHRPPSFNEADVSDKPNWLKDYDPLGVFRIREIDKFRLDQLRTLRSVDDQVDRLMTILKERGLLDNTVVIFLSDNGWFWGEHRLEGKRRVYEESSRIPMAIRYPPMIAANTTSSQIVANIDLYPTLLDLANVQSPNVCDGKSLVSLFSKPEQKLRDYIVIEGWPDDGDMHNQCSPRYAAIREKNLIYVESYRSVTHACKFKKDDRSELYDLVSDPYQLNNKIDDAKYSLDLMRLQEILRLENAKQQPFKENRTQHHEE